MILTEVDRGVWFGGADISDVGDGHNGGIVGGEENGEEQISRLRDERQIAEPRRIGLLSQCNGC